MLIVRGRTCEKDRAKAECRHPSAGSTGTARCSGPAVRRRSLDGCSNARDLAGRDSCCGDPGEEPSVVPLR